MCISVDFLWPVFRVQQVNSVLSKQFQQGVHQRPLGAAPSPPPRSVPVDRGLRQQRVSLTAAAVGRRRRAARHRGGDGRRESGEGHRSGPRGDAQLSLGIHRVAEPVGAGGEETVEKVGLLRPGNAAKRAIFASRWIALI